MNDLQDSFLCLLDMLKGCESYEVVKKIPNVLDVVAVIDGKKYSVTLIVSEESEGVRLTEAQLRTVRESLRY